MWATARTALIEAQNAGKNAEFRRKQSETRKRLWSQYAYRKQSAEAHAEKLSAEAVIEIRRRLASGERVGELARAFGVHQTLISHIKARRRWAHL
jgi:hypothetical protein